MLKSFFILIFAVAGGVTPPVRAADSHVYSAVYAVPTSPELAAAASSKLATTVALAKDQLAVTYTLPLDLTGGAVNRIELTGRYDAASGTYAMNSDKVTSSSCQFQDKELVCTSSYVPERLDFGTPAAGQAAATNVPAKLRAMRLQIAKQFSDEPRGVLRVFIDSTQLLGPSVASVAVVGE